MSKDHIKAISLTQPWATLVALGEKRVETRSWMTHYTGLLAIHSSKTYPQWARELCEQEPFRTSLYGCGLIPQGHVLCIVRLHGCRRTEDVREQLTEKERAFGDYSDGRFAWFLELVRKFEPTIPATGARGLWKWERDKP